MNKFYLDDFHDEMNPKDFEFDPYPKTFLEKIRFQFYKFIFRKVYSGK